MENPATRQSNKSTFSSNPSKKQDIQDSMSAPNTSPHDSSKKSNEGPVQSTFQRRGSADIILEAAKLAETMGGSSPVKYDSSRNLINSANNANSISSTTTNPNPFLDQVKNRSQQFNQVSPDEPTCTPEVQKDGNNSFQAILTPPTAPVLHPPTLSMAPVPASASGGGEHMNLNTNQHFKVTSSTTATFQPPPSSQAIASPQAPNSAQNMFSGSPPPLKHNIPHVYHDYAHVPDSIGFVRKKTGGVTQPFPEKLYEMLANESSPEGDPNSVVSWLPHGRAFIVRKPKLFTSRIMPTYFRQTKLTSFQRQLNLYGFRRITQGADAGAYYHELFLRGRAQLCMRMVRQKVKGTGHKQPTDVGSEPNFYTMPSLADLQQPPPSAAPTSPIVRPTCGFSTMAMAATSTLPSDTIVSVRPTSLGCLPMSPGIHAAQLLKGMANAPVIHSLPPLPPNATMDGTNGRGGIPSLSRRDANPQAPSIDKSSRESPTWETGQQKNVGATNEDCDGGQESEVFLAI